MLIDKLTIVGAGLIGGSIGLAARRRGLAREIVGIGGDPKSLEVAISRGAIHSGTTDLGQGVQGADFVVFCTPVDRIAAQVRQAAPHCSAGAILTDAGSTKAAIVYELREGLPAGVSFVGSHPLAGSEKRGPEHAHADLFHNRICIVTPDLLTEPAAVERVTAFWKALGADVRLLEPGEHDQILARTSHLPHLVASALAAMLPPEFLAYTASGFRDTTRIAASDPALWTSIFLQNAGQLMEALTSFEVQLKAYRQAIEAGDAEKIAELFTQGKQVRDALGS